MIDYVLGRFVGVDILPLPLLPPPLWPVNPEIVGMPYGVLGADAAV